MSTVLLYVLSFIFTGAFVIYTKWQIVDEDDGPGYTPAEKKWHMAGLFMRLAVFSMAVVWVFFPAPHWSHLPLIFILNAASFDIGINIANRKPPLYTATHGWDGMVGKRKWLIYLVGLIASIATIKKG